MAILTVHHWSDLDAGLAELRRVSHRQVVFTWDPEHARKLWIATDYVPEINVVDAERGATLDRVTSLLGAHTVLPFEVPWDFTDGFQAAYWRRPERYLDPVVRAASSTFASLPPEVVTPEIDRLRNDLESGKWHETYGSLLSADSMDYGYRILVADSRPHRP